MVEKTQSANKTYKKKDIAKWKAIVAEYQKPNAWRASWQIVNSIGGYAVLWYLMYLSFGVSWWLSSQEGC